MIALPLRDAWCARCDAVQRCDRNGCLTCRQLPDPPTNQRGKLPTPTVSAEVTRTSLKGRELAVNDRIARVALTFDRTWTKRQLVPKRAARLRSEFRKRTACSLCKQVGHIASSRRCPAREENKL